MTVRHGSGGAAGMVTQNPNAEDNTEQEGLYESNSAFSLRTQLPPSEFNEDLICNAGVLESKEFIKEVS